jgi:tetratricopeptide (TPR) repeat protein
MVSEKASAGGRLKQGAMVLLVFGLVLACYWPALRGGRLWDDKGHITRPDLQSWSGLLRIWTDVHATQQYYPVLHSAFWVEHCLWGDATIGYHLLNVFLHATSCCLVAFILRRLWGSRAGGSPAAVVPPGTEWLAALIFAAHPVCVESVAWIAEQKNTLSLVFYLLAVLAYLNFDERRRWASYALASGLFLLALGTKTVTATLPAALLVILWWRKGRLSWRRDVAPLSLWFVLAMAAGLVTAWVERNLIGAEGPSFDLPIGQRLLLPGRVIWFYLGKLFWPSGLIFIYPHWNLAADAAEWYGWLAAALAVTAALWLIRRRSRGPLAGWLFFVGSLAPALGFFNVYPFIYSYVADHFQYLASLGIIVTVAAGIGGFLGRAPPPVRAVGVALCGLLVGTLAVLANRQSASYRDVVTLYRETLARNPACWMAYNNLGVELAADGHKAEAITLYEQALRINSNYAEVHNNLAFELEKLPGRGWEALSHYEQALQIKPDYVTAHLNMAEFLARLPGREPEAIVHYEAALRLRPDDAAAHNNLAIIYAREGRFDDARKQWELALSLKPNDESIRGNLDRLRGLMGQ